MKKTLFFIMTIFFTLFSFNVYADNIVPEDTWSWTEVWTWITNDISIYADNYKIDYRKNLFINETLKIDLSKSKSELEKAFPENEILFEWNLKWETSKEGEIFEKKFDSYWEKEVNLGVYKIEDEEKKLLFSEKLNFFVYEKSISFIFDESIGDEKIEDFKNMAVKYWIYVYSIWTLKEKEVGNINLVEKISDYKKNFSISSDYVWVWWEKEFLFTVMSKINIEESKAEEKINLVLISPFNTQIIKNYLSNLVSSKSSIDNMLFIDESIRLQIINTPLEISKLENNLSKNKYSYLKLNTENKVEEYLFISKFINNLSNKWFSTSDIYIVLLLPFLFTIVSFSKHFIWLSPLWLTISVFFSVLFFKVWILVSTIVMLLILIINLILSKITNRYALLYTPKVSFITTVNIIIFIIVFNILFTYNILDTNLSDTIYIILFVIISERLVTIILSKELKEYSSNILNTFIISTVSFLIFNLDLSRTFILAYPEIIVLLVPINFIIWRFTGLRITEYLRFREIIKSIEEE